MKALIITLLLGIATVAAAQDSDPRDVARQHYRTGEARFKAGDYRAAMVAFLAADAVAPSATLIYNVAVCHERLGEAGEAARRYREYLARRKDAPNRAEVEARIAALDAATRAAQPLPPEYPDEGDAVATPRSLGPDPMAPVAPPAEPARRPYDDAFARRVPGPGQAEAAPEPHAPPPGPARVPEPMPGPAPKRERPLYKQWWFWVFVGVGAVILVDVATTSSGDGDRAGKPSGLTLIKF
jgi:hypothetical protein